MFFKNNGFGNIENESSLFTKQIFNVLETYKTPKLLLKILITKHLVTSLFVLNNKANE